MAIALADSGPHRKPEKTDSDAALALHLALNDSAERITFRGEPSGEGPASPPSVFPVTSLSTVCNVLNRPSHHGHRCDCRHNLRCGRGAVASSIRPVVLSSAGQALPQCLPQRPCLFCACGICVCDLKQKSDSRDRSLRCAAHSSRQWQHLRARGFGRFTKEVWMPVASLLLLSQIVTPDMLSQSATMRFCVSLQTGDAVGHVRLSRADREGGRQLPVQSARRSAVSQRRHARRREEDCRAPTPRVLRGERLRLTSLEGGGHRLLFVAGSICDMKCIIRGWL